MAEAPFDRARFEARLATRALGRTLVVRAETGSTNDDAWEAVAAGGPDGLTVVAAAQLRGRGRAGRTWAHAPGLGLALSVALRVRGAARHAGAIPLVAGLAVAVAAERLGVAPRLKWPNDVLVDGRKLAGLLCELRRAPAGGDVVVIGIGVNVRQREQDFAPGLRGRATSLALAGADAAVEDVAAEVLGALEPLWERMLAGAHAELLGEWSRRAAFWGEPVTVHGPGGDSSGVAQRLDPDGALVLRMPGGLEQRVVAGDLEAASGTESR